MIPKTHPLAEKALICVDDLIGLPLFCSEQSWHADIPRRAGSKIDQLKLEGSFQLAFRRLTPTLENKMYLVWKKYQVFSPMAERFLTKIRRDLTLY